MSSEPHREPIEPPGGFEQSPLPAEPANRPDWLVGADDGADFQRRPEGPPPTLSRPGGSSEPDPAPGRARPSFRLQTESPIERAPATEPEAEEPEPASGWSAAASSVPKLTVSSRTESKADRRRDDEDEYEEASGLEREENEDEAGEEGGDPEEPPVGLPHEPWWLVAVETLQTNRLIQLGIAAVLVLLAAWIFWPRKENQTVAIAAIKTHPERFEGQPVRVRGQVAEVWDTGAGVVFYFHQRRDTMVVYSKTRRPTPRERLVIVGTVSTGYLDGTPRVALFESGSAP